MTNPATNTEPFLGRIVIEHIIRKFVLRFKSQAFATWTHCFKPAKVIGAVCGDHLVYELLSRRRANHFAEVDKGAEVAMSNAEDLKGRIWEELEDVFLELNGNGEEAWKASRFGHDEVIYGR